MYFAGVDPIEKPIPIRPTAHYTMGGIDADIECRTALPGLFAAGEAACVSVHGANRLGGNSLLDTVVFGYRSAQPMIDHVLAADFAPVENGDLAATLDRVNKLLETTEGELPADLRQAMEKTMITNFGIFRDIAAMESAQPVLEDLFTRYQNVWLRHKGKTYNQDLVHLWQLGNMLELSRVVALGAKSRKESRGSHYLEEYPKYDNENFLRHTAVTRNEDASLNLAYKDVVIEDIEPQSEVKY